jgi:hypothetical protein
LKCSSSNCEECNNRECLKCNPGYNLSFGECVSKCEEGTFNLNGKCLPCSKGTKTCENEK